jgi:hypothetical protein
MFRESSMKPSPGNWKSRLIRLAGLALVGAALLFLTVQPVTNFIINREAFRVWLTAEIVRQSSGGTFQYSGITGSVFGMTLGDVEFAEGDPAANIRRARANRLHASFELLPLLHRELRLRSLELVDAEIDCRLDGTTAGHIRLPVGVNRIGLTRAWVNVEQTGGWTARFKNAQMTLRQRGNGAGLEIDLAASAENLELGTLTFGSFRMNGRLQADGVHLHEWSGNLAGGNAKGSGVWAPGPPSRILKSRLVLDGVDISPLLRALGRTSGMEGRLNMESEGWTGEWSPGRFDLRGAGTLRVSNFSVPIRLPRYPLLSGAEIYRLLDPVARLQGEIPFRCEGTRLHLESARWERPDARIDFQAGTVDLFGAWDWEGEVRLSGELREALPSAARTVLPKTDDGGVLVPVRLTGPVDEPSVEVTHGLARLLNNPILKLWPGN